VARFIDQFQPAIRRSEMKSPPPSREVDRQRVEASRHVTRLGLAEAAMAARLEKRVQHKPAALPLVMLALGYYMQARHMFKVSGLWDPALGAQPKPIFDRVAEIPRAVPVPSQVFSILGS
jgi:hypothetical protein